MASLTNEGSKSMRGIEVSGHITQSVAAEYIASAAHGNTQFESRSVCGWDVEFVEAQPSMKEHTDERLARLISCNQERTVVAVAFVGPADN